MNLTRTKLSVMVTAEVEITHMKLETEEVALSYQALLCFQADGHHQTGGRAGSLFHFDLFLCRQEQTLMSRGGKHSDTGQALESELWSVCHPTTNQLDLGHRKTVFIRV